MSWDNIVENWGFYAEVGSNRMARRALKCEIRSINSMAEDDTIAEWLPFLNEKSLTKSLKRDITTIVSKKLAEKAKTKATHKQGKDKDEKTYPDETETDE